MTVLECAYPTATSYRSDAHAPIVVVTDDAVRSTAAVRWAAVEALRRSIPLVRVGVGAACGTHEAGYSATMVVARGPDPGESSHRIAESVGVALSRHYDSPVVLVRDSARVGTVDSVEPVVVGADGSAAAERAVSVAAEEAVLRGTELLIVHTRTIGRFTSDPADARLVPTPRGASITADHTELLSAAAGIARATHPEVSVRTLAMCDRPAPVLLELSHHADLLVLGGSAPDPTCTGSTTEVLRLAAGCPLMVVPPDPREEQDG